MKKLLPNSKPSGFTLIELLVVVSIIAILAVIGMVMLGGLQGRARDAERRAEVDAILKAYEIKHDAATGEYPDDVDIDPGDFADGEIPTPPNYDPTDISKQYRVTPTGTNRKTITVCATLETVTPPRYCKSGAQGSTGTSQTCTTDFSQNCRAAVSIGSVPPNAYIACPSNALNCNVSGPTPLITEVQYWTTSSDITPATGTMDIYPVNGNSRPTVLIDEHQ